MFNLFGNSDPAQPVANTEVAPAPGTLMQPAVAEPGNLPPSGNPSAQPPVNAPQPANPAEPIDNSPLAEFKDMWDTVPNESGDNTAPVPLDPVKLKEVIAKSDFSTVITPEHLAAITAGGEEATAAFTGSMNQVAQHVMNQSLLASNKMIENAVDKVNNAWEAKLPQLLKKQSLNENLVSADPLFNNPAIKPIMEATQMQLAAKFPNATVAELTNMTQKYIKVMGESFAPKQATPNNGAADDDTDWERFMSNS